MPAIVTASQLRQILGVSVSLYSDAQLDSFIDSAEQTILPLLTQYQSSVTFANVTDSVIYFTTMRPNYFVPGQSVVVTGAGTYSATYTVTDDRMSLTPLQLQQLRLIVIIRCHLFQRQQRH
jgi:hypothetical protein